MKGKNNMRSFFVSLGMCMFVLLTSSLAYASVPDKKVADLMRIGDPENFDTSDPQIINRLQSEQDEYRRNYKQVPDAAYKPATSTFQKKGSKEDLSSLQQELKDAYGPKMIIACLQRPCAWNVDFDGDKKQDLAFQVLSPGAHETGIAVKFKTRLYLIGVKSSAGALNQEIKNLQSWTVVQRSQLSQPPGNMAGDGLVIVDKPGKVVSSLLYWDGKIFKFSRNTQVK